MTTRDSRCVFCDELLSGRTTGVWDTAIAETDGYVIVPSKGAVVPGWLLVLSKRHLLCAGELCPDEIERLEETVETAKALVERGFGSATVFEHGPAGPGTALGCGIDHLHMHVVSLPFSLVQAVESIFGQMIWSKVTLPDLARWHRAGSGYAAVQEPNRAMLACRPPSGVRQLLRRAIAQQMGVPHAYDYATHPHTQNVELTLSRLMTST
jgi:ATP adenylyltransferase